ARGSGRCGHGSVPLPGAAPPGSTNIVRACDAAVAGAAAGGGVGSTNIVRALAAALAGAGGTCAPGSGNVCVKGTCGAPTGGGALLGGRCRGGMPGGTSVAATFGADTRSITTLPSLDCGRAPDIGSSQRRAPAGCVNAQWVHAARSVRDAFMPGS